MKKNELIVKQALLNEELIEDLANANRKLSEVRAIILIHLNKKQQKLFSEVINI
jgi:hypothetical protein